MEFIREYFDPADGKYVLEFETTEAEKKKLDEYCEQNNTTLDELAEKFLKKCTENPEEFSKWLKSVREDKFPLGTLGKPKCKYGEKVGFYLKPYGEDEEKFFIGTVEIIDAYGTFDQHIEPSYDIMVEDFNGQGKTLVKHVKESECYDLRE